MGVSASLSSNFGGRGRIRTYNVYHLGHGFTDRCRQPFGYPSMFEGGHERVYRDLAPALASVVHVRAIVIKSHWLIPDNM